MTVGRHGKAGNSDSLIVLEAGMKYQQVSLSPADIQLIESRRFQIEDLCRFIGLCRYLSVGD